MEKITIAKSHGKGATITTSQANYKRLEKTALQGCPFPNYSAIDLLHDLLFMYDYVMDYGKAYDIADFLTLCNDTHAEAYKHIFIG